MRQEPLKDYLHIRSSSDDAINGVKISYFTLCLSNKELLSLKEREVGAVAEWSKALLYRENKRKP